MKKSLVVFLLALISVFVFAVPNGCYDGISGIAKGRKCAIHIGGSTFSVTNRNGDVIARWEIVSERDGTLYLKSQFGASATATWWREDGKVYLNWNGAIHVLN